MTDADDGNGSTSLTLTRLRFVLPPMYPVHTLQIAEALAPLIARIRRRDTSLANQVSRASASIAFNLAEGNRRVGRDRLHLFRVADGSCSEVRTALRVAIAFRYLSLAETTPCAQLLDREGRLLHGLLNLRR
jgi:four helix bundle protein